jgi:hypothetical protein
MKRVAMLIMIAFLAVVLLPIVGLWILVFVLEYPGGMPSSYKPSDHDRRLTLVAREAAPIIETIDRYYQAHGRCPGGGDLAELRETLPPSVIATHVDSVASVIQFRRPQSSPGWLWLYSAHKPTVCGLWRKLGWDPSIRWVRSEGGTRWIFDPGDGSEEKEVVLDLAAGHM